MPSTYDRVRNFIGRKSALEKELTDQALKSDIFSARHGMDMSSVFSAKNNVYKEIPMMIQDPIIASCVAVIMETAFQPTADDNIVKVNSPYSKITDELEGFHREYDIDSAILTTGYNTLVYGNVPIKIEFSTDTKFDRYSFVPDFKAVTPIVVSNRPIGFMYNGEFFDAFEFAYAQLLHYRDLGSLSHMAFSGPTAAEPKGKFENEFILAPSYLSPAVRPWRNVRIIEDALLLQRIDVSNYMRIIGVNVGDQVFSKNAIRLLNFYRQIFKKVRRVSFDGDGMSSSSFGNDFEVVVPTTSSQQLDIKDIGGQIDIRALRDLDIQYKRMFSALRIQPSFIGYSEDVPSSLGTSSASQRWDERFARLVKAVRVSTTKAIKKIDTVYLRSKGYDVTEDDFTYVYVAASTVEDEERRETLSKYIQGITDISSALTSAEIPFNKEYLVKELFAQALASTSVDISKLFDDGSKEKAKKESLKSPVDSSKAILSADRTKYRKEFVKVGLLTEAEAGADAKQSIKSSVSSTPLTYARYLSYGDYLASGMNVDISDAVKIVSLQTGTFVCKEKSTVMAPNKSVLTDAKEHLADNLSSGSIASIENLYLTDDGVYLTGPDLYNYLFMLDQGVKGIPVKHLWVEKGK